MRNRLRILAAGLVLGACLTVSALAADFTTCADHLHDLGLFQGTNAGYELDRAPTRAEAAVMLVRLLGQEDTAKTLTYSAPFTDLADWEKPYVQYLYENGLTKGTGAQAFSPDESCTAQMYAAFLLRALGYTEKAGDYTYQQAVDFATELGLYHVATVDTQNLLRDHVVAASYTALALTPKDSNQTLLAQLVEQGAVEKQAAQPYQTLFAAYNRYAADAADMENVDALALTHTLQMDATQTMGQSSVFSMTSEETIQLDGTGPALLNGRVITLSANGTSDAVRTEQMYIADGMCYKMRGIIKQCSEVSQRQMELLTAQYGQIPLALVEEIRYQGGTAELTCSPAAMNCVSLLLGAAQQAVEQPLDAQSVQSLRVTQRLSGGRIQSQLVAATFADESTTVTVQSNAKLSAVNEAVTITPPSDLDQYTKVASN